MTTRGGGWMATLISGTFSNNQQRWFENAGTGNGGTEAFPTAIEQPPNGFAAGPVMGIRSSISRAIGVNEIRATNYRSTGELYLDVVKDDVLNSSVGMYCFATGCDGNPTFNQTFNGNVTVIGGRAFPEGSQRYSDVGSWGCNCSEALQIGGSGAGQSDGVAIAGDWDSLDGYTVFWIR